MAYQQDAFRQNYLSRLAAEIRDRAAKDDINEAFAAGHVIAETLGYDEDEAEFVDGAGDRGIDFWYASDGGLYVYQVKTHNLTESGQLNLHIPFDNTGVVDLMRAKNFLFSNQNLDDDNKLSKIKDTLQRIRRNRQSRQVDNPVHISLILVILGERLTEQAFQELADFEASLLDENNDEIQFHVELLNIDNILRGFWREDNREWTDIEGKRRDSIRLQPMRQSDTKHYLNDDRSAIFYCRAYDLVLAYEEFGYQIFEPNVRANIRNSKVNNAIQESASHRRSMKEFRFLNNGITIICTNYRLPSGQRPAFLITKPGIVNGLQTVTSVHRAYKGLTDQDKEYFKEHCYLLVRILKEHAVDRIEEVVLATNNQNPMQARNLVSNATEQIHFAIMFAEMGWFYEAKQGAWDAYKKDPRRWRPRINGSPSNFKAKKGFKRLDNHELAQNWFAFVGFALRAFNDKKHLFDTENYKLAFLARIQAHAHGHYSNVKDALNESVNSSPDPHLMLVTHLTRQFAANVVPTSQANKREALERANISNRGEISTAEEERIFSEDDEYLLNQALRAMSLVFVEFVGWSLFRVFAEDAHNIGSILLRTPSWQILSETFDIEGVVHIVNEEEFETNDILPKMWFFFREAVETLMNNSWKTAYLTSRYKPRYLLNNRSQIYNEVEKMDKALQRRVPLRVYTEGIESGEGYFGYLERVIRSYR